MKRFISLLSVVLLLAPGACTDGNDDMNDVYDSVITPDFTISDGEIVASGPIDMTEEGIIIKSDYTDRDCWWFIRRSGDRFQLQVLERLAGFLWRPLDRATRGRSYQLSLQEQHLGCTFDVLQLTSLDGFSGMDA